MSIKDRGAKRLPDGNFIFMWKRSNFWYLVLTSNDGQHLSDGWDDGNGFKKMKPDQWRDKDTNAYSIANFKGTLSNMKYLRDEHGRTVDNIHVFILSSLYSTYL